MPLLKKFLNSRPMLKQVQIFNYKSFASTKVALQSFTVLVGPNGKKHKKIHTFHRINFLFKLAYSNLVLYFGRQMEYTYRNCCRCSLYVCPDDNCHYRPEIYLQGTYEKAIGDFMEAQSLVSGSVAFAVGCVLRYFRGQPAFS